MNNTEENFSFKKNKSNLTISFERVAFIFFVFFIISLVFSSKTIFLGLQKKITIKTLMKKEKFRASIMDRDGNIIAKTVQITNLGINPNQVINKEKLLISLKLIFPDKNFKDQLNGNKFFYIKKKNIT